MSTFKNWTDYDVAAHNARATRTLNELHGEGCTDESKLHDQIIAECRHRGWWFSHSRMDRRTTTALGHTDFIIAADGGRTFYIEAKTRTGKLTREQSGTIHWLGNLGHKACVVRSLDAFLKATI